MFQKIILPSFSGKWGQIRVSDCVTLKIKALQSLKFVGNNYTMTQHSIPNNLNHWVRNVLCKKQRAVVSKVDNRKTK
jgi:isocitrate dehydrogenase kinase/phosphatase